MKFDLKKLESWYLEHVKDWVGVEFFVYGEARKGNYIPATYLALEQEAWAFQNIYFYLVFMCSIFLLMAMVLWPHDILLLTSSAIGLLFLSISYSASMVLRDKLKQEIYKLMEVE